MAKKVSVKLDQKGMGQLLAGREVARMVRSSGDRIAARAGEGFEADTWISPSRGVSRRGNSNPPRVVSGVAPIDARARVKQARSNVLQRSRDAGRV